VVTDGQVEIRYVIPTTPASTKTRFCHLRTDYFQIKPTQERLPQQVQIERAGPCHHSHSTFGGRVLAGTRWTWTRMMVPRTIGRGPPVPWRGWRCCLGCNPA
jgi:hypothetical protein